MTFPTKPKRIFARQHGLRLSHILAATGMLAFQSAALAAPAGGNIVGGSGVISQPNTNTTVIEQQSQALAIDWQSFNIAGNESVQFHQPNQNASALNRILDQNPSRIFGSISANGKVFLINPNGMVFGAGSQVNVGALVAGTLNIGTEDFLAGRYDFSSADQAPYGSILNQGTLTANPDGSITLLADGVRNEGLIVANVGQITLASGRHAVMSFDGNRLLNFSLDGAALDNAITSHANVENSGSLLADGGSVVLSAKAASDVLSNVVNNEGVIRANRIDNSGGVVRLLGSGGITINSGNIDASGSGDGTTGGTVEITGNRVGITGVATISVDGTDGGGTISIGKTLSSVTSDTLSQYTQIGSHTQLSANALGSGDGGGVTVWAGDTVWSYGAISAQGGAAAGNGGFVDISGLAGIVFNGTVDLSAPNGILGTLLFDPTDIVIHDGGGQPNDGLLPDLSDLTRGAGSFDISESALEALAGNATIILEASNNITINDLADDQLSLATTTSGSITLRADNDNDGTGAFTMATGDTLTTQGGAVTISGATITTGAISTDIAGTNDGAISITSTGNATVGSLNAGSKTVTVTVDANNNGANSLTINGTLSGSSVSLHGGTDGSETLLGPNTNNNWTITALGAGTLNGAAFSNFTSLTGGSADDNFVVSGLGRISGMIDGGAHTSGDTVNYAASSNVVSIALGVDVSNVETLIGNGADYTLAAANVANTWVITGQNDGTVAGVAFTDFSNLTGGNDTDTFTLNGGSVTGTISGGAGTDTLTANNVSNSWNILSANGGNVDNVFAFTSIENITGGSGNDTFILNGGTISGTVNGGSGTDSLAPDNVANTWSISGANAGVVTGVGAFTSIENLNGRNNVDTFTFSIGGSISGTVDGGGGNDSVDLSALAGSITVDLSGSGYANIERYTGNNSNGTLIGDDIPNTWVINGTFDGLNDGLLNGSITFVDFNNLTGGADTDTFTFNGGSIDGLVNGGGGSDTLVGDNASNTWTITANNAGTLNALSFASIENLTGNLGADVFLFSNGSSISGAVNGAAGNDVVNFSGEAGVVTVAIGGAGFNNIESYVGNNTNSTLIGSNTANNWTLTGQNDGLLGTVQFTDFNNLTGNANIDTFTISGGSLTGTMDGGAGNDILIGGNQANTWNVTGTDTGNIIGSVNLFSNIENITGNAAADDFIIADGASISGIINGAGGSDTVDYSPIVGLVNTSLDASDVINIETVIGNGANSTLTGGNTISTWTITSVDSGIVNTVNFVNFSNLVGNAAVDTFVMSGGSVTGSIDGGGSSDTFFGANTDTVWNITGTDTGNLTGVNSFSSIELLRGGSGIDTFVFANGGSYSGTLNGGTGNDVLNLAAQSGAITVDLSAGKILSIESLIGNATNSTLVGDNASHVWTISGSDSGLLDSTTFSGFNNLVGGSNSDFFNISGGSLSGTLNGGAGTDAIAADNSNNTWTITGSNSGSVTGLFGFIGIENISGGLLIDNFVFENLGTISGTVNGSGGTDSVDLSAKSGAVAISLDGSTYSNIETFIGNNSGSTLTGANTSNTWAITGINDGTVGGVTFFNFDNIQGNSSSDNFIFNDGSSITGSLDGGPGLDVVDFSADSGAVNVQLGTVGFSNVETFIGNNTSSTITGDNIVNNWIITGQNDGSVGSTNFSNFNNLVGNANTDTFTLNGGTVTGFIDGGGGSDKLIAGSGNNNWLITSVDAGNVTGVGSFISIENLQGNTGIDAFVFNNGGSISGVVNGLAGQDSVDESAQSGAITISLGATGYTNIESFLGNNVNSTLVGSDVQNTWVITGVNSGTVGAVSFTGFTSLTGGSQIDNFTVNGGTLSGTINGGAGNDTLTGGTGLNTWNISGTDVGDVTGIASFGSIESLIGNSGVDNFVFANGSAFTGSIDGAGGVDSVNFSSELGAVTVTVAANTYANIESFIGNNTNSTLVANNSVNTWTITGNNTGSLNSYSFQGFNNLTGNNSSDGFFISGGSITGTVNGGGGDDTIYGGSAANTWTVTASDAGNVNGIASFTNIDNLVGGTLSDIFNINANLSGLVDGGAGDDQFTLGTGIAVGGGIAGGSGTDSLTGPNAISTWTISGSDSGSVNGIPFSQIENITGGNGIDTFTIGNAASVSFSGNINGGAGNDILDIDFAGASSRVIQFDGSSGTDSIVLRGGGGSFTANFALGAASGEGTATTTGFSTTQTVSITNSEAVEDIQTATTLTLQGSAGNDAMQIGTGTAAGSSPVMVSLGASLPYDAANKTNLVIDGVGGNDSLAVTGSASVNGSLTLNNIEQITDTASGTLAATALSVDGATTIGSAIAPLITNVDTLDIQGSTDTAYLREQDGLAFSADTIGGTLDLATDAGDITSNGAIIVTGGASFSVGDAGSILLTNAGNSLANTPAFSSSGTIADLSLVTDSDVTLPALALSGDLFIQADGAISQTGAISVAGTTDINATNHGITLSNGGNDFGGVVALQNSGNNNVVIADATALQFATSILGSGTLVINAASISQTGPITQDSSAGDVTLNVSGGSVNLNNAANEFTGRLHLYNVGSGTMTVVDASELLLGSSSSNGGDIRLSAQNGVDANSTVSSSNGNITITTQSGDIQLGRLDAGTGVITMTASNGAILGNNSPITDPNLTAGDLIITAGTNIGDYTNPIALRVPSDGTSLFIAGEEPANIIGNAGRILGSSILVNNVSVTSEVVGIGQNAFLYRAIFEESTEAERRRKLYSISDSGIRLPYVIGK